MNVSLPEMKCLYCGDELRLEDIEGHLYAHGFLPPWEAEATAAATVAVHEGGPTCIDCDKPFQHLPRDPDRLAEPWADPPSKKVGAP